MKIQLTQGPERTGTRKLTVVIDPTTDHEKYLNEIVDALAKTERVFAHGSRICTDRSGKLEYLDRPNTLAKFAGRAVNLLKVDSSGKAKTIDLSVGEANFIMNSVELRSRLPQIEYFTEVPVIDQRMNIVVPGFNPESGIYYQGAEIRPVQSRVHLDRLREILCFARDTDWTSFLAFLLTAFVGPRFAGQRPIANLAGNQQGIGKTTAAQILLAVHSATPKMLSVTFDLNDAELEKGRRWMFDYSEAYLTFGFRNQSRRDNLFPRLDRAMNEFEYFNTVLWIHESGTGNRIGCRSRNARPG